MKRAIMQSGLAAAVVGLGTIGASAGPVRTGIVSDDATWVAHVDVEAFISSRIGQFALEHREEMDLDELDEVRRELGIDPLHEIFGVTAYGIGDDESTIVGVVEVSDVIDDVIDRVEEEAGDAYRRFQRSGLTIHSIEDDETVYATIVSSGRRGRRAIVGSQDLDLVIEGARLLEDGGRSRLGRRGPRDGSIIFIAARELPGMNHDHGPASALLQKARGLTLDMGEDGDELYLRGALRTDDTEVAQKLAQAAQGLIAMAQIAAMSEPDVAQYAHLLSGMNIGLDDDTLTLAFDIDIDDLAELIEEHGVFDDEDEVFDDDEWDDDRADEEERIRELEEKIRRLERLLEDQDG